MCAYDECVYVHMMSVHVCVQRVCMCVYRECACVCMVSIASFPGHLPFRFLDRIQGHVCGQENGVGDGLGMRLWFG